MGITLQSLKQIEINADIKKVWQILTESHYTKEYMFNCSVFTDWKIGSPISWEGNFQGYDAFQKGKVLEYKPYSVIKYTTFDPYFGLNDIPENYIHVCYKLEEKDGATLLTIINETFDGNNERITHIDQGWDFVIGGLKNVAEARL